MYSVLQGVSLFLPSASSPSAEQSIDWNQKIGLFEPGRGEKGFGQLYVLGGFSLRSFLGDSEKIFLPFSNMGQKSARFIYMISSDAHFYRMSHGEGLFPNLGTYKPGSARETHISHYSPGNPGEFLKCVFLFSGCTQGLVGS